MADPVNEGLDAGLMEAADALMDIIHKDESDADDWPATIPLDWRDFPHDVAIRDAIYFFGLAERQCGREEMREAALNRLRALALSVDGEPGAEDWVNLAADTVASIPARDLPAPAKDT